MKDDLERLRQIIGQRSEEESRDLLKNHLEMVAAGEKDEKERTPTTKRTKTWGKSSYGEGSKTTSSKVVGGEGFTNSS